MPWVTGKDFKRFYVDSSEERLSEAGAAELNEVPTGATLVLVRGMMLLNYVPVALATAPLRINQDVRALVPRNGINGEFIAWSVRAREEQLRASVDLAGHGTGRLATEFLRELHIWLPERRVQDKVVRVLSAWERSHQILTRLLGAKRQMRDGVAAALLTGQRRLPGFARQRWREVRLGEVTRESTRRNGDRLGTDRVMAVTKSVGLTRMRDRTMSDSLARYKVVRPGGFAYNPMRLNIGSIARSSFKRDVLVSPDYVVFEAVPESLDPRFLD
jgi:type I restriction enzyme S subunit